MDNHLISENTWNCFKTNEFIYNKKKINYTSTKPSLKINCFGHHY